LIKHCGIKDDAKKIELIGEFFENNKSEKINSQDLIDLMSKLEIKDDAKKIELIGNFFEINKSEKINSNDLIDLMSKLEIKDDAKKIELIEKLIENDQILIDKNSDKLTGFINELAISDDRKNKLISEIKSKKTVNTDIKNPEAEKVIANQKEGR